MASEALLAARERYAGIKSRLRAQRADAAAKVDSYKKLAAEASVTAAAHGMLLGLADSARDKVRARVEDVVTLALRGVFGGANKFRFDTSLSRGVVNMTPVVGTDATGWMKLTECAGGVVDVVAFALRATLLCWHRPNLRPVLFADEPFRHVSDDYLPAVAEMLKELSVVTGLQMVVVSHEPTLADCADRVISVHRHPKTGSNFSVDRGRP